MKAYLTAMLLVSACHSEPAGPNLNENRVPNSAVDNLYRVPPSTSNVPMVNTFVSFDKRGRCLIARSSRLDFTPVFVTSLPIAIESDSVRIGNRRLTFGRPYEFIGATGSTQKNGSVNNGCPQRTMSIPGPPQGTG